MKEENVDSFNNIGPEVKSSTEAVLSSQLSDYSNVNLQNFCILLQITETCQVSNALLRNIFIVNNTQASLDYAMLIFSPATNLVSI